jgi:hypothetical protein
MWCFLGASSALGTTSLARESLPIFSPLLLDPTYRATPEASIYIKPVPRFVVVLDHTATWRRYVVMCGYLGGVAYFDA